MPGVSKLVVVRTFAPILVGAAPGPSLISDGMTTGEVFSSTVSPYTFADPFSSDPFAAPLMCGRTRTPPTLPRTATEATDVAGAESKRPTRNTGERGGRGDPLLRVSSAVCPPPSISFHHHTNSGAERSPAATGVRCRGPPACDTTSGCYCSAGVAGYHSSDTVDGEGDGSFETEGDAFAPGEPNTPGEDHTSPTSNSAPSPCAHGHAFRRRAGVRCAAETRGGALHQPRPDDNSIRRTRRQFERRRAAGRQKDLGGPEHAGARAPPPPRPPRLLGRRGGGVARQDEELVGLAGVEELRTARGLLPESAVPPGTPVAQKRVRGAALLGGVRVDAVAPPAPNASGGLALWGLGAQRTHRRRRRGSEGARQDWYESPSHTPPAPPRCHAPKSAAASTATAAATAATSAPLLFVGAGVQETAAPGPQSAEETGTWGGMLLCCLLSLLLVFTTAGQGIPQLSCELRVRRSPRRRLSGSRHSGHRAAARGNYKNLSLLLFAGLLACGDRGRVLLAGATPMGTLTNAEFKQATWGTL